MAYFRCGMGGGSSDNFDFIAPAFSTSEAYNMDDLVIKDGSLYKCTEDNVTGTWNASKWKNTTLAECSSLDSNLGNNIVRSFFNSDSKIIPSSGYTLSISPVAKNGDTLIFATPANTVSLTDGSATLINTFTCKIPGDSATFLIYKITADNPTLTFSIKSGYYTCYQYIVLAKSFAQAEATTACVKNNYYLLLFSQQNNACHISSLGNADIYKQITVCGYRENYGTSIVVLNALEDFTPIIGSTITTGVATQIIRLSS